ncbi:11503_t:CDS:10 [Dentiscutata heterogama]|uniref:11503_t:CDS:1 n=1 Tax=Dentiscutata heterogama TaxID=1316150 RepID=A0ACA9KB22_9GLOM|nr:11503_t:CDS:10 [Dentiscutata heterogama]
MNPIHYDENIVLNEQEQEQDIVPNVQDISNEQYMISSGKDMILSSVGNSNYTGTGTSAQSTVSSFMKHRPLPERWIQQHTEDGNEFTSGNKQENDIRKTDIRVVVALEIGTTHSGFAYANKANPEPITNDHVECIRLNSYPINLIKCSALSNGPEQDKTNTVLAYDDNLQLVAWGYPALAQGFPKKKKALVRPQPKPVELFMLHLANIKEEDKPPLPPGLNAERVITDYLHEMNKLILETLNSRWPGILYPQQIRFVLPVPAEWNDEARAIMRLCMYNAGYLGHRQSENLVFITEPEAIAIYCMKTLTSFLIVDCKESTVDLTTMILLPNMKIGEITERSGDLCGSSYVDREFLKFIGRKLGFAALKKLKENHYEQMQYFVQQFCSRVKFSFNGNPNEYSPRELDIERICPALMQYVTGQDKDLMEEAEWFIELDFQAVKDMFDPVVKKIIDLIQRQCASTERRPAAMFLVGVFSENLYLQTQIRRHFATQIPIIAVPKHPMAAIERGALEYGLNLDVVQTRVLKYCYGVEVNAKWETHDPPQRRTPSGRVFRFHRLALRGVEVDVDQKFYYTYTADQNQTDMTFNLFITPDNNAKYCDEDGMKMLGRLKIYLSDSREQKKSKGFSFTLKKRVVEVELILTFGTMEIKATAINKKTGQVYESVFELEF